jgi:putative intracellular protease/amidase
MTTTKRRALIVISSARQFPLAEPAGAAAISTGFYLVELAQVLKEFENEYEFTFATPDGNAPQLDINGLNLAFHATDKLGLASLTTTVGQRRRSFTVDRYRRHHASLAARREQELQLLERHLGRLPVSDVLPNTEPDVAALHPEVVARLAKLPQRDFPSVEALVRRHRDPRDEFTFADFDFIHAPGGHAPMVDFGDNPWLGEALHLARESRVLVSLICHAPIAVASTRQRIDSDGNPYPVTDNPFQQATVTMMSKPGELIAFTTGYPRIPGHRTRPSYYIDEAVKEAGFTVKTSLNPSAVMLIHEPAVGLLTGNGPQAIDAQTHEIREIVSARTGHTDARQAA